MARPTLRAKALADKQAAAADGDYDQFYTMDQIIYAFDKLLGLISEVAPLDDEWQEIKEALQKT